MAAGFVQSFCMSVFLPFLLLVFAQSSLASGSTIGRCHGRSSPCEAGDEATKQRVRIESRTRATMKTASTFYQPWRNNSWR